jgi:VWFA-related protein
MRARLPLALLLFTAPALAQNPPSTLTVTSNLVIVPTLVTAPTGDLVHTLHAGDFTLLDNGVPQHVTLEDVDQQPLAVLVLMQTGASGSRQFANYAGLPSLLDALTAGASRRFSLITFDSQPEYQWPFTSTLADLKYPLTYPEEGDHGAAIFDAVNQGIDILSRQPPSERRILLLLSQTLDDGSANHPADVIRRLGENNITLYSVTFSPSKTWLKDQFTKPRHGLPPTVLEPNPGVTTPGRPVLVYGFDIGTPLMMAINAARSNAAAELARLSGGESFPFDNRHDFDNQLTQIANHIPNRYMLTFTPSSKQPGFHTLRVQIPGQPDLKISARPSYWLSSPK